MVQKFQPEENLANSGVENRENRHVDSNVCDPLLELKDNMSEGARDFDQDLNRYSPRDRVAAQLPFQISSSEVESNGLLCDFTVRCDPFLQVRLDFSMHLQHMVLYDSMESREKTSK